MKSIVAAAFLTISTYAVGQATVSITAGCTPSASCTTTTVEANGFAATGTSSGGVSMTSNGSTAAPSIPGIGVPASTIMLFAPSTVQTPYAIALTPTTAALSPPSSGFWYSTLGTAATFCATTLSGQAVSGFVGTCATGANGVTTAGSGYFVPPPCYFSGGSPAPSTPATCYFILGTGASAGTISQVYISSGGAGYTGTAPSVAAVPTLDLSYLPPSNTTTLITNAGVINTYYSIQTSYGTLTSGHLASFDSTYDVVDSGVPIGGSATPTAANYLRGNGTYFTSSAIQAGDVPLTGLATQAANTVVGNGTASSASPTALAMPSCSAAADALIWTTSTGFGCNAAVNASTLGGATFASPGAIGGTTPAAGSFTGLTVTAGGTTTYDGSSSGSETVGCTNSTCTGISITGILTTGTVTSSGHINQSATGKYAGS